MKQNYDKVLKVDIEKDKTLKVIAKALNCKNRRDILRLLSRNMMSVSEISEQLHAPISTISEHIKILIEAGLVSVANKKNERGQGKLITRQYEKVLISIANSESVVNLRSLSYNIPIGSYSDFSINQYCGMVGTGGYIAPRDDKFSFYSPARFAAQLIWFDYGYLEYKIPIKKIEARKLASITLSAELCSEAPGYDLNWKSDIYFEINGKEVCLYTSPSDFGDRKGRFSPEWWHNGNTQYGLIKQIEVNKKGTFLDGNFVSPITINELNIANSPLVTIRIGVHENSKHRGGINIFGDKFGDYPQNISLTINYLE